MGLTPMSGLEAGSTLGPLLIGLLFAAFLFGILTLQTHLYYRSFFNDSISVRLLAAFLMGLNALHLGFISHAQYYYLVTNFAQTNVNNISIPIWTLVMSFTVTALVIFIVQCYYAWKFWIFSKKNTTFTTISILLPLSRLGVSIAKTVVGLGIGGIAQVERQNSWIYAAYGTMLPSDLWLTCSMVYFVNRSRKQMNLDEPLFRCVMLYLIHTAAIPCLLTLVAFICFIALDNNLTFIAIHFVMGELYTSCLLVILNSRTPINGRGKYTASYTTSSATMLSANVFGKTTLRSDVTISQDIQLEAASPDDFQTSSNGFRTLKHISTSNIEYRGKRDRTPGTPIYQPESVTDDESSLPSGSTACSNYNTKLSPQPLPTVPEDANLSISDSIRRSHSSVTLESHSTNPNMSWESVETRDMERSGHDIGDLQWDGDAIRWHAEAKK